MLKIDFYTVCKLILQKRDKLVQSKKINSVVLCAYSVNSVQQNYYTEFTEKTRSMHRG